MEVFLCQGDWVEGCVGLFLEVVDVYVVVGDDYDLFFWIVVFVDGENVFLQLWQLWIVEVDVFEVEEVVEDGFVVGYFDE